jgi:hypothetical protein
MPAVRRSVSADRFAPLTTREHINEHGTHDPDATEALMNTTAGAPLTRLDRCDRCGAAALLRASLAGGGELLFCGHHAREHGPALHLQQARMSIELCETHSSARPGIPAAPGADGTESWVSHPG